MKNNWKLKLIAGSTLFLIGLIGFILFFDVPQFSGFFRNGSFNPKSLLILTGILVMSYGNLIFLQGAREYRDLLQEEDEEADT